MQILLLSMPDSFEHMPTVAIRMPNGALTSLAGNVDTHHDVAIADLILVQSSAKPTVERLMRTLQPDVVGLSVMTFQRPTARRIIALVRAIKPETVIVVGGYDPSLAPEEWVHPALGVDVIVRGEGDVTFRELIRALEERRPLSGRLRISFMLTTVETSVFSVWTAAASAFTVTVSAVPETDMPRSTVVRAPTASVIPDRTRLEKPPLVALIS